MPLERRNINNDMKVKLVAAFKGVTFIPAPFVFGQNNLNPKLILKDNEIEFKNLFFTQIKQYSEIKEVGIYINKVKILGVTTTNIFLSFKNSIFTFSGNLNNEEMLREILAVFKKKGCSLTLNAKLFLDNQVKTNN